MSMADHYTINVARRIAPDTKPFGPYHTHVMKMELPHGCTKQEATEIFTDACARYPEPNFKLSMTEWVCRGYQRGESGDKGVKRKLEAKA